ncbi:carboxylesterase/lipase family protein [Actinophytocola oryzae]|uniref:Carboxylic ester hydrolase n=1 Tax=Actinophytocola oryzae TaxID=502181 RepID=A0A4R7V1P4_9PSEU|nr:carboxylesterase family protein [Actinophytocola oryzae]TDV43228.1 para-nitrobenzyl esterase [Actinophytocola oryzae]
MVEVRVESGVVRGRTEDGLAVFRGIPFAEPPVGALRFAAPVPVRRWDGVRDAVTFGPPAPQDLGFLGVPGEIDAPPGDGWLTVNVWSPSPDRAARLPVLVWIYGGAYKLGYSGSPGYDARRVAGEVVVVSFDYRLGVEGFAWIDGAPANRGFLDQLAALTWVRENIGAFGGDPDRVTVVGESSGAGSIAAMYAMPAARGLFQRAVLQSVPGTFFSESLAADVSKAIAAELGLSPTVAELSAVAPATLTAAGVALAGKMGDHRERWGSLAYSRFPFAPVVDGAVLPVTPWEALAAGAGRDVPLVAGHNRDEARLFLALAGELGRVTDEQAALALRVFGPGPGSERAYREAYPEASAERLYELVQSDLVFRMPSVRVADAQVAGGGRAHLYETTWRGGPLGACHAIAGPLMFGTFDTQLGPMLLGPEPGPGVAALSADFRGAWTTFAATGDPGWPAYDPERRLTRLFDVPPSVEPYPEERSRLLWRDHPFPPMPLHPAVSPSPSGLP